MPSSHVSARRHHPVGDSQSASAGEELSRRSTPRSKPNRIFYSESDEQSPPMSSKRAKDRKNRKNDENDQSLDISSPRKAKYSRNFIFSDSYTSHSKSIATINEPAKEMINVALEYDLIESDVEDDVTDDDVPAKIIADYSPVHFLRCHSLRGDPSDVQTELWSCQFQPDRDDVVATAGGRTICLLDATSGVLLKKFTHPSQTERLGVMTWLRIRNGAASDVNRRISILAVGGTDHVHLVHPDYLTWYKSFRVGEMRGCDVTAIIAHPRRSRWLLVATGDEYVSLWDVGVPSPPLYDVEPALLLKFSISEPALSLVFIPTSELLLAACDDGMVGWKLTLDTIRDGLVPRDITYQFPTSKVKGKNNESGKEVAALAMLGETHIAAKCIDHGCIYVWPVSSLLPKTYSRRVDLSSGAVILPWSDTDACYLGMSAGRTLLAAGDDRGAVWLYGWRSDSGGGDDSGGQRRLHWPRPTDDQLARAGKVPLHKFPILVRSVCLSQDESRLVAVTHNNMVCIWHRVDAPDTKEPA